MTEDTLLPLNWSSRQVDVPGAGQLWSEATGPEDGPPVLLIMGAMNPGLMWPPGFVRGLVEGGCRVLRYDARDTGRSFVSGFQQAVYTVDDLARDAVRVLDAWGVASATVVGWSMGGYVAQTMARDAPQRVARLVLLGSSPDHRPYMAGVMGREAPADASLPGPDPAFVEALWTLSATAGAVSPQEGIVRSWQLFHGGSHPFPLARVQAQAAEMIANGHRPSAALRHALAADASPPRTAWLGALRVPTLVLHGAHDPSLPLAHGEALAQGIPGARLVVLDMGHLVPDALEASVARTVLGFMDGARKAG